MNTSNLSKKFFLEIYEKLNDEIKYILFIPEQFYTLHNRMERVIDEFQDKKSEYFNQLCSRYTERMRVLNTLLPISSVIEYKPQNYAIVADKIDDFDKDKVFRELNKYESDNYFVSFNPLRILKQLVEKDVFNDVIEELNITYRNNYTVMLLPLNEEARSIHKEAIEEYEGLQIHENGLVKNNKGVQVSMNGTHIALLLDITQSHKELDENQKPKSFIYKENRYMSSNLRDLYQNINNRIKVLGFKISKTRDKQEYRLIPLSS